MELLVESDVDLEADGDRLEEAFVDAFQGVISNDSFNRLIVEADGPFHDAARDAERDAWLAGQNFRVLRFPNGMIDHEGWRVIAAILEAVRANGDAPPPLG